MSLIYMSSSLICTKPSVAVLCTTKVIENSRPYRIFRDSIGAGKQKKGFYIMKKGKRKYINKKIVVNKKKYKAPKLHKKVYNKLKVVNKRVVGDILSNYFTHSQVGKVVQDTFKNIQGNVSKVGDVTNTYNIQKDLLDIKKENEGIKTTNDDIKAENDKIKEIAEQSLKYQKSAAKARDFIKLEQMTRKILLPKLLPVLEEKEVKEKLKISHPTVFKKENPDEYVNQNTLGVELFKNIKRGDPLYQGVRELIGKDKTAKVYDFELFPLLEPNEKVGNGILKGINENQINAVMLSFPKSRFIKAFAYDEFWNFIDTTNNDNFSCIFNSVERDNNSIGHWVAFNCDKKTRSIEFYDSFGRDLGIGEQTKLGVFGNRVAPEISWEYKPNGVKQQSETSDNCGWFCIEFLLLRRINNLTFEDATGFSNISDNEKAILKLKNRFRFI